MIVPSVVTGNIAVDALKGHLSWNLHEWTAFPFAELHSEPILLCTVAKSETGDRPNAIDVGSVVVVRIAVVVDIGKIGRRDHEQRMPNCLLFRTFCGFVFGSSLKSLVVGFS